MLECNTTWQFSAVMIKLQRMTMKESQSTLKRPGLPDYNRLSSVIGAVLLVFLTGRLVNIPLAEIETQILGFYIQFQLDIQKILPPFVSILTATGMDWLLRDHPKLGGKTTLPHFLIPSITAWAISVPVFQLELNALWWISILISTLVLAIVFVSEYILLDTEDSLWTPASIIIIAIAFALYFLLVSSLRSGDTRLYLFLPSFSVATFLLIARVIHIQTRGQWMWLETIFATLILGELAAALHYLPISPRKFGFITAGFTYLLSNFIAGFHPKKENRQTLIETTLLTIIFVLAILWIR